MAEYLEALVAESVIDPKTSALVGSAYNRLHYGSLDPDAFELRQASQCLRDVVVAIAALSGDARGLIAERVRRRLSIPAPGEAALVRPGETESTDFEPRFEASRVASYEDLGERLPADDPNQKPGSKGSRRREIRINSVPLETATLVVVGLVVGGYILRGGADQAIAPGSSNAGSSKRTKVGAGDVWRHEDYWAANLRHRAQTEAARKQEQSARLGFELLISEVPKDAGALNDLAWLYLTSEDLSLRNPQRGLELALRALAISRQPAILDTAAEAEYQTGRPDEAIKLEQEALDLVPRFSGFQDTQFLTTLRRQLEKFQGAAKSYPSQASSPKS
jgi:tetratricopeptide (TPR) repeat protein